MRTSRLSSVLSAILLASIGNLASAGPSSQTGYIFDHTSYAGGLLIRFDPSVTSLPDNCAGATSNWMLIRDTSKIMISVALIAIASNNRVMSIYTSGVGASGYCEIHQVDPAG